MEPIPIVTPPAMDACPFPELPAEGHHVNLFLNHWKFSHSKHLSDNPMQSQFTIFDPDFISNWAFKFFGVL